MKIMSKILLIISFALQPMTQCGVFNRFAHNLSSRLRTETFEDMHHGTVDLETVGSLIENSDLDTPLKNSRYLTAGQLAALPFALGAVALGGLVVRGYIAYENARYTKKLTLLEKVAEDNSGIPCAAVRLINNRYDFSKLKRFSSLDFELRDDGIFVQGIKVPCIFRYSLPEGKTVDVLWDCHGSKESEILTKELFKNKKFERGIIELCIRSTLLINKEFSLGDNWAFFSTFSYNLEHTRSLIKLLSHDVTKADGFTSIVRLLDSHNVEILPLEYSTGCEDFLAHTKEGISIIDYTNLDEYNDRNKDRSMCARNKKMAQTIVDVSSDENNKGNTFVLMGAAHGFDTFEILKEHLGEPELINFDRAPTADELYRQMMSRLKPWLS